MKSSQKPNSIPTIVYSNEKKASPGAVAVVNSPTHGQLSAKEQSIQRTKNIVKTAIISVTAAVVLLLVLTYVIGPTEVNGISMNPTFRTGNFLLVWKLPQTWARITDSQYIPKRGDVVIVDDTNNSGEQFVKRVIGLPNDRIYIANGVVTVYGNKYPDGLHPDNAPYGKTLQPTQGMFTGQVGDGQIFVMGDNRVAGASIDSRSSLGNIPSNYIVGQVLIRVFPFNQIKLF